ncbi:MAG: rhodanese-like domain-containing protein, partial [Bacteroidota bacterium]|nr:rhodanese-like domain-containing protein [Bacteroidota bacterium]
MRTTNQIVWAVLLSVLIACSGGNKPKQAESSDSNEVKSASIELNDEAQKMLKYLEESGDYVNGRNFPSLIKASSVYEELSGNIKIIDLRSPEAYAKGHIKGAVNVDFTKIPDYFT